MFWCLYVLTIIFLIPIPSSSPQLFPQLNGSLIQPSLPSFHPSSPSRHSLLITDALRFTVLIYYQLTSWTYLAAKNKKNIKASFTSPLATNLLSCVHLCLFISRFLPGLIYYLMHLIATLSFLNLKYMTGSEYITV